MKLRKPRALLCAFMVVGGLVGGLLQAPAADATHGTCPPWDDQLLHVQRVEVQSDGVCVYTKPTLRPAAVGIWYSDADTRVTVGQDGNLFLQPGVSICYYQDQPTGPSINSPRAWNRTCISDPSVVLSGATWATPDATSPYAFAGTTAGPCAWVERHRNLLPYVATEDAAGHACFFTGGSASVASPGPGKEGEVRAEPGVCVVVYPYGSCFVVEWRTYADARTAVPVVHQSVAVCERTWPYPPCVVRFERWLAPADAVAVEPTGGNANGTFVAVAEGGCANASEGVAMSTNATSTRCDNGHNSRGGLAALSTYGWSRAPVAVSAGAAEGTATCPAVPDFACTPVAVSGTGPAYSTSSGSTAVAVDDSASAGLVAVAGTGNAGAKQVAVSGTGDADGGTGMVAVSGTGNARNALVSVDTRPHE